MLGVQAKVTMEAKGESMAAAFLETLDADSFGASVEGGGAHWFATPAGDGDDAEAAADAQVDGKLFFEVRESPSRHLLSSVSRAGLHTTLHATSRHARDRLRGCDGVAEPAAEPFACVQIEYRFQKSGALAMDVRVDTSSFMPRRLQGELNSLPRIGFELTLPKALQRCVWHGRCAFHAVP